MSPRGSVYTDKGARKVRVIGWVSVVVLVAMVIIVLQAWGEGRDSVWKVYAVGGFWAIIPPFWFWYEYHYIYRSEGIEGSFEYFKYGQQVSIAIWAGVTLSCVAVATSENFKPPKEKDCKAAVRIEAPAK